jgi:hypothetical protein
MTMSAYVNINPTSYVHDLAVLSQSVDVRKMLLVRMWLLDMVFNATFNPISAISWLPILLVEETGVLGNNYRPLLYNIASSTHRLSRIRNHNFSGDRH